MTHIRISQVQQELPQSSNVLEGFDDDASIQAARELYTLLTQTPAQVPSALSETVKKALQRVSPDMMSMMAVAQLQYSLRGLAPSKIREGMNSALVEFKLRKEPEDR